MAERVTVIGAGIVGICTALSLLEKGFSVEVLDRDPPAEGASHGNQNRVPRCRRRQEAGVLPEVAV